MKKLIVLSIIMAIILLVAAIVHAQSPATDLKPTFISPTPGLYVNGWPAFTVSYPKEWVEWPPLPGGVLSIGVPRPDLGVGYFLPSLTIVVLPIPLSLEEWPKIFMRGWVEFFTDIKVLSDKPSQLKDGTLAREVEIEFVFKNGPKANGLVLATKKEMMWVVVQLFDDSGRVGEDLKKIAYSLTFLTGREEPVQVPPDVRAFLDMYCADAVSHDVELIMAHYSDRFRHSGISKAFLEQFIRNNDPTSPIQRGVISQEATVTVFEAHGERVYLDGFFLSKVKGDANALKSAMSWQQIINEHGQWKWFGNQK